MTRILLDRFIQRGIASKITKNAATTGLLKLKKLANLCQPLSCNIVTCAARSAAAGRKPSFNIAE